MKNKISEISVVYSTTPNQQDVFIHTSSKVHEVFRNHWNEDTLEFQEEFKVMLLNRCNKVLGIYLVSKGGLSETIVDLKIIFAIALKAVASSIILAHNHPSGNLKPSSTDLALTQRIQEAGELLSIKVLDHIILTKSSYYSFADNDHL